MASLIFGGACLVLAAIITWTTTAPNPKEEDHAQGN